MCVRGEERMDSGVLSYDQEIELEEFVGLCKANISEPG